MTQLYKKGDVVYWMGEDGRPCQGIVDRYSMLTGVYVMEGKHIVRSVLIWPDLESLLKEIK